MLSILKPFKKIPNYNIIRDFLFRLCYRLAYTVYSDKKYIQMQYIKHLGKHADLENPKTLNEKIQWLKLNWYDPLATKCADKYEARNIVKERWGADILNQLYKVYDRVEDIELNELPNEFVLKATHGSGFNIIVRDKNQLDWKKEKSKLKLWLKTKFYHANREWVYREIKPRIICEKLLTDKKGNLPNDYKFFCFNGIPKFMFVCTDRFKGTKFDFFDLKWSRYNLRQHYPNSDKFIEKPQNFEKMVEISKKLSEGFPFVRIDFYSLDDEVIFGEMTFFHFSGFESFEPEQYDSIFGELIDIEKIKAIQKAG